MTNTAVDKNFFHSVIYQSTIWFLFTHQGSSDDIKCRVSYDEGDTYNSTFDVAATTSNEFTFDATYSLAGSGNCDIAYLSALPASPFETSVHYATSSFTTPTVFSGFFPVNDLTFNTIQEQFDYFAPTVFEIPGNTNRGIYWFNGISEHLFDYSIPTGINEMSTGALSIYPNPASTFCRLNTNDNFEILHLSIKTLDGKQLFVSDDYIGNEIDLSAINDGIYIVECITDKSVVSSRLTVQH